MPYSSNADLPTAVKKLSTTLQTAWRKAFNAAYQQYKGDERLAYATAWSTVNKMRGSESLHPNFLKILTLFQSKYGERTGTDKFMTFVTNNALDYTMPYHPRYQIRESLNPYMPSIQFLREDKSAKFYKVSAIHAIVSMNGKDYTDAEMMDKASGSMNYRPININHNTNRWLPYPRTRLDYSVFDDFVVEGILRVDNRDKWLQLALDHDPSTPRSQWISHPSIEGRPNLGGMSEGYHFTALSLLEMGHELPGDPLTEIAPLFAESVGGAQACMWIEGKYVCEDCLIPADQLEESIMSENNDNKLMEAEWGNAYKRSLPDSSYAYIEPNSPKDPDTGHTKQQYRHMPIKDKAGNYDRIHVAAALQALGGARQTAPPPYASQAKGKVCAGASALNMKSTVCGTSNEAIEYEDYEKDKTLVEKVLITMQESYKISTINPEGAVCPQCGHKITPDPTIDAEAIKCPRCGTTMKRLPEKVVEKLDEEHIKELFRPPFNGDLNSYNKQFKKHTGADLLPSSIPTVGEVTGAKIGIVEAAQIQARNKDLELQLETVKLNTRKRENELLEQVADLQDKISGYEKNKAHDTAWRGEYERAIEEKADVEAKRLELESLLGERDKSIAGYKKKIIDLEESEKYSAEKIGKLEARNTTLTEQAHDALSTASKNSDRAKKEIQERAQIQEEMSELRQETASLTRRIAELTEKLSVVSTKLLEQEKAHNALIEQKESEVRKLQAGLDKKDGLIEKARKYQKWANRELSKAGVVFVE